MRRLLVVFMLICALCLPALGGHHQLGGFWCDCDDPNHIANGLTIEDKAEIQQTQAPVSEVSELDLLIDVLLIFARF